MFEEPEDVDEMLKPDHSVDLGLRFAPAPKTALEYLQSIYRDPAQPDVRRMRAAALAIPFESPKLAVTAYLHETEDFAAKLDRALERSGMRPKVIEARANGGGPDERS